MTQSIVVLGGLGDVYLVAALYESFARQHGSAELVIKSGHVAVLELFPGVPYRVDDAITFGTEADRDFQRSHDNVLGTGPFFAHPCMLRSRVCLDGLSTKPGMTQADIFRLILGLGHDAPLSVARPPAGGEPLPGTVMIVEAATWPDTQPGFYPRLADALRGTEREVWVNDKKLPLRDLFARAAATEWVIGPQCGLMSIFVTGRWPCRKTLATPDIDGGRAPAYWSKSTFPYAYVSKFAGFDHDVEEYKIEDGNHDELIGLILHGANASRSSPHDPGPVTGITMQLSPGDFLDRYAVLCVKRMRFTGARRAAIERDYQRHAEAARGILRPPVEILFSHLVDVHREAFDILERAVPEALDHGGMAIEDHVAVIQANKARVRLRQQIDMALHAAYTEVKSYYGD